MQSQAGPSTAHLQADDYLLPLATLRDALLSPSSPGLPVPKLRQLLSYHLDILQRPWEPFKPPQGSSKTALESSSITVPRSKATLAVDADSRKVALKLADKIKVDEVSCFLLFRSYQAYALDRIETERALREGRDAEVHDQLVRWYMEECVAAVQVVLAALSAPEPDEDNEDVVDVATGVRDEVLQDVPAFIEGLFRAFGGLAQRRLEGYQRSHLALEWATHQLRLQDAILQLLFAVLYQNPARPALVSEALIRGSIMSNFGTQQANTEFWENSSECARLEIRIRDLLILITCESLCLGSALSDETDKDVEGSLLGDKARLASVNDFLQAESLDLDAQGATLDDQEASRATDWPIAVICLAWACILRETPDSLRPTGGDEDACFAMTRRALAGTSGLFDWLERLLSGPLLEPKREDVGGGILSNLLVSRKKVIKDLLIGLSQLVQLDFISDRPALYRVWEQLFGGSDPSSSLALGTDYWSYDFEYAPRRAILDESRFPLQATNLLQVLSSLAGPASYNDTTNCEACCRYFSHLPRLTFVTRPDAYRIITRQSDGRRLVETSRHIVLPGGVVLSPNTSGVVISREDDPQDVITYALQDKRLGGWPILGVLLREASGMPASLGEATLALSEESNPLYLSVADLGISADADDILATGLKFCLAVLRPTSPIALDILTALSPDRSRPAVHVMTDLLSHVLQSSTAYDTSPARLRIVEHAISLLSVLLQLPTGECWSHLRATGFFLVSSNARKKNTAARLFAGDVARGEYGSTLAILRLVLAMVARPVNLPTPDDVLLRAALHTVFVEVWSVFQAWRYRDIGQKWEIASVLLDVFDSAMRHPGAVNEVSMPAADLLSGVFIASTSLATYRPFVNVITEFEQIVRRLMGMRRTAEAQTVIATFENAIGFLATLLRLSEKAGLGTSPARSVLGISVTSSKGQKVQLIDLLLDIACAPSTPESVSVGILKTFRTFFATSSSADDLSLTSSLRNAQRSFEDVATLLSSPSVAHQTGAWRLLAAATSTQPGCSTFTIGSTASQPLGSILSIATTTVQEWEDAFASSPRVLSACLAYCKSIISASPSSPAVAELRKEAAFWQAVYDISRRHIPPPPTVLLSAKSSDFIPRVEAYSYRMSARAEATSLLATELGAILDADEDPRDSKAHHHVLSLFRNKAQLQEASLLAVHSSCDPSVHEAQRHNLSAAEVPLAGIQQLRLPGEAEYGGSYLYDPDVAVYGEGQTRSLVNLAIDLLNTSWSVLDADMALTRAFRSLVEQVSAWTEGDALAQAAATQVGLAVAEVLSDETRGGDVMLAIQHERLSVLAILVETATSEDSIIDSTHLARYASAIRSILESQTFPPILSMRQAELPPLHRPILRILNALAPSFAAAETDDGLFEVVFSFVAEAADIVLDAVIRNQPSPFLDDLGSVVGIICELSKIAPTSTIWLDKLGEYDLIGRSLQVIINARMVPPQTSHAESSKAASPESGTITSAVSAVLLLHLALSSVPTSAEKLAISGLLSAYSDNALVALAESALLSPASSPSAHDAWCSMLQVVRSLLCALPDTATYVRTDVIPWVRVCIPQLLKAMAWDPQETPGTSRAELDELELTCDLFLSISAAIGPGSAGPSGLLLDWAVPALELLANIQWALSHPNLFASSILPADEDEHESLVKELEPLDSIDPQNQVKLGDWDRNPVACSRMAYLARITRGVVLALINFTSAWGTLKGGEAAEQTVLSMDQPKVAAHDPVGIILDLHAQLVSLTDALSASSKPEAKAARETTYQTTEAMAVLCTAQLVTRHLLLPSSGEHAGRSTDGDGSMEVDQVVSRGSHDERKRRGSALDQAGDDDESGLLGQLTSDLQIGRAHV